MAIIMPPFEKAQFKWPYQPYVLGYELYTKKEAICVSQKHFAAYYMYMHAWNLTRSKSGRMIVITYNTQ